MTDALRELSNLAFSSSAVLRTTTVSLVNLLLLSGIEMHLYTLFIFFLNELANVLHFQLNTN
jgi:hypothetical protein